MTWGDTIVERDLRGVTVRAFEPRPTGLIEVLFDGRGDDGQDLLVQGQRRVSRRHLRTDALAFAGRLQAAGMRPGDRVMLLAANSPAWAAAFFGIVAGGGVPVLGNGWWPADDVHHAVALTSVGLAVVDERPRRGLPAGVDAIALDGPVPSSDGSREPASIVSDEDAPALVLFTSGTTSRAKAVVLSHRSVLANLHNLLHRTGHLPGNGPRPASTVHLCTLPLFHMSGVQTLLLAVLTEARVVFAAGRFDPAEVLALIEREQVTAWAAVPTMLAMVLDHPDLSRRDVSSLRSLAVGGAPVPPGLLTRAERAFPNIRRRTGESYGSSEAGGTVATTTYDPKSDTVGPRPFPTIDVRVAEPGPDGAGELLVRSAAVMEGYLGVAGDDQPVDTDGWLHTGDLGRVDEHGVLHLIGRIKDIIIRGGENVAPAYVEAVLRGHPEVVDVAVVGLPHPLWGEEVAAVVRHSHGRAPDIAVLTAAAQARLARYAVPSRWQLTTAPFPTTETGKVRRDLLAANFTTAVDA